MKGGEFPGDFPSFLWSTKVLCDSVVYSRVHCAVLCRLALVLRLWEGKTERAYEVLGTGSQEADGEWMYQLEEKVRARV